MFEKGIHLSAEAFRGLPDSTQRLDVRERWEYGLAKLPGAILIPLGELADRVRELDPARPVAAYCHHGVRSLHALRLLHGSGFTELAHLSGGIEAYSRMDPSVPRY
ncbi:MAG: rhodanese-like domain-containing protein [Geothrix sp.]|nr:rhodanese-like domain-containing protein [Geothrix sp.]